MTNKHNNDSDRVLVTGASGFLGGHVVTTLLDRGYNVVAHHNQRHLLPKIAERCERVVAGDIRDAEVQRKGLQNVQTVCHLAAYIPPKFNGIKDAVHCYSVNAQAALELATMAAEKGVRRFIHFSTGNMYEKSDSPCIETDKIYPAEYASDYFVSKLAAEIYLTNISKQFPMEVVILRIGAPYGPGEPANKVIPTFLRLASQGQPLRVLNGGISTANFVFVSDIADITEKAINGGSQGIYNVASGENTSLTELANTIIAMYTENNVVLSIEPAAKDAFLGFQSISIEKAKDEFGFSPRSLAEGLIAYRSTL